MKQIAVVIPLYNHAAYVGDAIRSVLAQTRAVDKIVIVDDGSTDDSVEIVRAFAEPRIELYTQPNAGAHAALNRGIEKAAGCDYIAILNSDDVFARERIFKCAAFLDETHAIDVVATRLRLIDSAGSEIAFSDPRAKWFAAAWSVHGSQLGLVEQLGVANFISSTSNLTGRRAYFLDHPFRHYRYAHDYFFVLDCALHNRLAVLDDELFSYRVHSKNTISVGPEKLVRELLEMNVDLLDALAPELAASPNLRRALAAYQRAAWGNVSSFRADVFVSLVAYVLGEYEARSSRPMKTSYRRCTRGIQQLIRKGKLEGVAKVSGERLLWFFLHQNNILRLDKNSFTRIAVGTDQIHANCNLSSLRGATDNGD